MLLQGGHFYQDCSRILLTVQSFLFSQKSIDPGEFEHKSKIKGSLDTRLHQNREWSKQPLHHRVMVRDCFLMRNVWYSLYPPCQAVIGKTRTHCGGSILTYDVACRIDARNVSEDFQGNLYVHDANLVSTMNVAHVAKRVNIWEI